MKFNVGVASYCCAKRDSAEKVQRVMILFGANAYQKWGYPKYLHASIYREDEQPFVRLSPSATRGHSIWSVSERARRGKQYSIQISLNDKQAHYFPSRPMEYDISAIFDIETNIVIVPWPTHKRAEQPRPPGPGCESPWRPAG